MFHFISLLLAKKDRIFVSIKGGEYTKRNSTINTNGRTINGLSNIYIFSKPPTV